LDHTVHFETLDDAQSREVR